MERYEQYKDSRVEWLGEIPQHWEVKKIKYISKLQGGFAFKSDSFTDSGIPIIRIGDIKPIIDFDGCKNIPEQLAVPKKFVLQKNDTLIALSGATTGKTTFVELEPKYSYINQRVAKVGFDNKLLFFNITSDFVHKLIMLTADGSAQENISNSQIENIDIAIPVSKPEQTAIAKYLDRKTAEIDQLIAQKKHLLRLYQEEKTALINQAVTQGLNPAVTLKESGIEWLGEIPSEWKMISIKHLVSTKITDGPHETPNFVDDGIPFLSVESVQNNKLDFNKKRGFITKEAHEEYSKKCKPQRDDVFLVKSGSTTGKSTIVETDIDFNIWSPLCIIRSNPFKMIPRYTFLSLQSDYFRKFVELSWSFGTQPNIGMGVVENIRIIVPPLEEQTAIVQHIETETSHINAKIAKTQKIIALQKEYRAALISEVVTGKIKVTKEVGS